MNTKQLRQKILDLAIRGKLVPQDPNDEPASALLERIRIEKERLIKEGKVRRDNKDSYVICDNDKIHDEQLPQGWEWATLSSLAVFAGGKTPSTENPLFWNGNVNWVTSKDMKQKYIESTQIKMSEKGAEQMQLFPPNTLIMVVRSGILRHTLPVAILKAESTVNQDLKTISFFVPELCDFAYFFFVATNNFILKEYHKDGTTVDSINFDKLKNIAIPLPPLAEQHRIVAAIESTFEVIDEIERNKTDLQAAVTTAKQKILSLAIRGKLVSQDPNDEPAAVLLEHIRVERERLIKTGKIKRNKKDSTVFEIDEMRYGELPQGWEYARLSDICLLITDGTHQTPTYSEKGYVFLSSKNVTSGKIDWENVMYIPQELHDALYNRLAPEVGDILLAKNGTTGYAAVVDKDCVFDIYVSLALIRVFKNEIYPEYLRHIISSELVQSHFKGNLKGIGVPNLHLEHIRSAIIPICPLNEQRRIITAIEAAFEQLDRIALNI